MHLLPRTCMQALKLDSSSQAAARQEALTELLQESFEGASTADIVSQANEVGWLG